MNIAFFNRDEKFRLVPLHIYDITGFYNPCSYPYILDLTEYSNLPIPDLMKSINTVIGIKRLKSNDIIYSLMDIRVTSRKMYY